jgi:putative restriction endonuclease
MTIDVSDTLMRTAAFDHVRRLCEVHDHLTAAELKPGFLFQGERIPLINPQRGIFKPQQMRYLLSIKTVYPKPGGKVWYDDQREVHRQIFEGDETIDYAFMGQERYYISASFVDHGKIEYDSELVALYAADLPS